LEIEMSNQRIHNGNVVTVLAVAGGWSQIQLADGSKTKVRNSTLTAVPANVQVKGGTESVNADAKKAIDAAPKAAPAKKTAKVTTEADPTTVTPAQIEAAVIADAQDAPAKPYNRAADKKATAEKSAKTGEQVKPKVEAKAAPAKAPVAKTVHAMADEGDAPAATTTSVVDPKYKARLQKTDLKTASGSKVVDNGDTVAVLLRGKTLDEAYAAAAADMTGWTHKKFSASGSKDAAAIEKQLRDAYGHLNLGQQRMNLGNVLRTWHKLSDEQKAEAQAARAEKAGKKAA
jgi:hypothetical protein